METLLFTIYFINHLTLYIHRFTQLENLKEILVQSNRYSLPRSFGPAAQLVSHQSRPVRSSLCGPVMTSNLSTLYGRATPAS